MEQFDYTENQVLERKVSAEVEALTGEQLEGVYRMIQEMKDTAYTKNIKEQKQWFENAILPILKKYAELTSSVLEVEEEEKDIINARLRNKVRLYLDEEGGMRIAIMAAAFIVLEKEGDELILSLTFDCQKQMI